MIRPTRRSISGPPWPAVPVWIMVTGGWSFVAMERILLQSMRRFVMTSLPMLTVSGIILKTIRKESTNTMQKIMRWNGWEHCPVWEKAVVWWEIICCQKRIFWSIKFSKMQSVTGDGVWIFMRRTDYWISTCFLLTVIFMTAYTRSLIALTIRKILRTCTWREEISVPPDWDWQAPESSDAAPLEVRQWVLLLLCVINMPAIRGSWHLM